MNPPELDLGKLSTPCIVLDLQIVSDNIQRMQRAITQAGCCFRPHIKTHKLAALAKTQLEAGAQGITCAKVSEAEVMAAAGIQDIFIAYPIVGRERIRRVLALRKRVKRLIVGVDSIAGISLLHQAAAADDIVVEVRLEIDSGAGRTGVSPFEAAQAARQLRSMPHLNLTGIYTFKGLLYQGAFTENAQQAAQEEAAVLAETAGALKQAGFPIRELSGGSTPTGIALARTGLVNEVRAGTYVFNDWMMLREHAADMEEIAARCYTTVVSCPKPNYAVIDAGSKAIATDVPLHAKPFLFDSYALVVDHPHLKLTKLYEEHGILTAESGVTGLAVGDIIALIPTHICPTVNLYSHVYGWDHITLARMRVDARGMLE